MPVKTLKDYLDTHGVKYVVIHHSPAFTAKEIAALAHIPGRELAKTVMVIVDGKMSMAVLPAADAVDFGLLRETCGAREVRLATEKEFKDQFPDCELGAMPPFGNLYGMNVTVATDLVKGEEITFNAGTHRELIRMAYRDFEHLVQPKVMHFEVESV